MQSIRERLADVPQVGRVEWLGLSPEPRAEIRTVEQVRARVGHGLDGDYHSEKHPGGKRQVTLIQHEHLAVIASLAGISQAPPELLRRNIVVSGINLTSLKGQQFAIGEALLEGTGPCDPCSRMEENLGRGGFQAMRGHGGLTAAVLRDGIIRIGDEVRVVVGEPAA